MMSLLSTEGGSLDTTGEQCLDKNPNRYPPPRDRHPGQATTPKMGSRPAAGRARASRSGQRDDQYPLLRSNHPGWGSTHDSSRPAQTTMRDRCSPRRGCNTTTQADEDGRQPEGREAKPHQNSQSDSIARASTIVGRISIPNAGRSSTPPSF